MVVVLVGKINIIILIGLLLLFSSETQGGGVPCQKYDINIIDNNVPNPESIYIRDEADIDILEKLRRLGYIWEKNKYRIERNEGHPEIWVFCDQDPVILLTTTSLAEME